MNKRFKFKPKKRGFPLIRLVFLSVLFFFLARFFFSFKSATKQTIQSADVITDIPFETTNLPHSKKTPEKIVCSYIVKPGDSFYTIFNQFGISKGMLEKIIQSFKKLDVHTVYPKDSIIFEKNADSSFYSVNFFSRLQNKYSIKWEDHENIFVKKETLPVIKHSYLLNGELTTSLSESMFSLGVGDVVTAAIAEIFAWDINFFIDPRKGDLFQILFEKRYINGKCVGIGDVLAAKYTLNKKTFYAYAFKDTEGKRHYFDENGDALQKQFLKAPLSYSRISSTYSFKRKHPVLGIVRPHLGVDYAAPNGTPVCAAADGKVSFVGIKADYGKLVILSHGGIYQTYYGHLSSFGKNIVAGKQVNQGDVVGKVGATGLATGPHLDYRMKKNGAFINPLNHISPSLQAVNDGQKVTFVMIREKCNQLFNNRFSEQKGCFLLEIQEPNDISSVVEVTCTNEQSINQSE